MAHQDESRGSVANVLAGTDLPTFRGTILSTLKTIRDLDTTAVEIAEQLRYDPQLVVHLLRLVNSAAMGLRQQVEGPAQAVSFLGRSRQETIVLALAVKDSLPSPDGRGFESRRFWTAAAQRATLAKLLAQELCPTLEDECFTVGLLQDMAVPLLASAHPKSYGSILEAWHTAPEAELSALERSEFGWTHGEIGELVAGLWELPERLARGIGAHHGGQADQELPPAVHLVSFVRETELSAGIERLVVEAEHFGLEADRTVEVVITACDRATELADLFV